VTHITQIGLYQKLPKIDLAEKKEVKKMNFQGNNKQKNKIFYRMNFLATYVLFSLTYL
jgi:hypothetical protein